jgi:hypothetical protein
VSRDVMAATMTFARGSQRLPTAATRKSRGAPPCRAVAAAFRVLERDATMNWPASGRGQAHHQISWAEL